MHQGIYRYTFNTETTPEEIECTLLLSVVAAEALHGEAQVRLDAFYSLDRKQKLCDIDATTKVGQDLNRLFVGFISREFGTDAFVVSRSSLSTHPRQREGTHDCIGLPG